MINRSIASSGNNGKRLSLERAFGWQHTLGRSLNYAPKRGRWFFFYSIPIEENYHRLYSSIEEYSRHVCRSRRATRLYYISINPVRPGRRGEILVGNNSTLNDQLSVLSWVETWLDAEGSSRSRCVCPSRLIGRVCFTPAWLHSTGNDKQMTNTATLSLIGGGERRERKESRKTCGIIAALVEGGGGGGRGGGEGRGRQGPGRKGWRGKPKKEQRRLFPTFCYRICMAACTVVHRLLLAF